VNVTVALVEMPFVPLKTRSETTSRSIAMV
jgi:hypothetical protein